MIPRDLIDDLVATLEQLRQILPSNKATWDDQLVVRLAVERLAGPDQMGTLFKAMAITQTSAAPPFSE